jgi:hypothetical protein
VKLNIMIGIFIYLIISACLWLIRITPAPGNEHDYKLDCVVRYIDYVFPITRLHCPVN